MNNNVSTIDCESPDIDAVFSMEMFRIPVGDAVFFSDIFCDAGGHMGIQFLGE